MAKQPWFPRKESDRRTLLNNLADKLPGSYATKYAITSGELTTLENFRLWNNWAFDCLENIRQKAQAYTGFRDDLCYGSSIASGNLVPPQDFALPAQPATGTPPVVITPVANGWKFTASLVNRVKSHAAYTTADGNDLGIEGPDQPLPDAQTTKPVIKAVRVSGGNVEVQWKKLNFTGVKIQVDRGSGVWADLAVDTEPHYVDTFTLAPGATALWKYRAIYLNGDAPFGQWSDVASIAVQG